MNISTSHPFAGQLIPSDRFERICRDPTPPPLSQSVIQNKRNGPSSSNSQRERERSSTPKSFLQKARLQAERKKKNSPEKMRGLQQVVRVILHLPYPGFHWFFFSS